jgi:hypothetical protein
MSEIRGWAEMYEICVWDIIAIYGRVFSTWRLEPSLKRMQPRKRGKISSVYNPRGKSGLPPSYPLVSHKNLESILISCTLMSQLNKTKENSR